MKKIYTAIDLFSGCGGLTQGLKDAGFNVVASVEIDKMAAETFKLNHSTTLVIENNIRNVSIRSLKNILNGNELDLLAGCPPCQGFSSIRRRNKSMSVRDKRNSLISEFLRIVKGLRPLTFMLENVPGLANYYLFGEITKKLKKIGYKLDYKTINVKDYEVPQQRKRLVLLGSRLAKLNIAEKSKIKVTVRDAIRSYRNNKDNLHKIYAKHSREVMRRIKLIPKNGGSRKDIPNKYNLECHKKQNVGFHDVYGRLRWDDYSTTITGGCLNPSKGRFLHPEKNRALTAREAALLQTFPKTYKFPAHATKTQIALMIGNALPPRFSYFQSKHILNHIKKHLKT